MYISTDIYFASKNFIVSTFYGERTCFCWNEDKLVVFPYTNDTVAPVEVLTAPAPIKTIQCFSDRIFLICIPRGLYKLSKHKEFAVLSKSAVGMGTIFYEVLTPRNKYLYLDNKQKMTSTILYQLSSEECDSTKVCACPLNADNMEEHFMRALTNNDDTVENLCIIGDGVKLFRLVNEAVQIVYSSSHVIRHITPILKNSQVAGLLLLTDTDIMITMYAKDNKLLFDKVFLGTRVQSVCVGFSQLSEDTLWIVYSDVSKLYYVKKDLQVDSIQRIRVEDKSFVCLQAYDSKMILGLTACKQVVEISTDTVERTLSMGKDTFVNIHSSMLDGASCIMEKIYKSTLELHSWNEILTIEEDKLRNINLYAHKYKVQLHLKLEINRIANQFFLHADLHEELPKNSWIMLNVKSEHRRVFFTKNLSEQATILDICIPQNLASNFSQITIDLIALKDAGYPWCLIRDFMIHSGLRKSKRKRAQANDFNFVNTKIALLQDYINEGHIDMKKLSEIKKSVRSRFTNV